MFKQQLHLSQYKFLRYIDLSGNITDNIWPIITPAGRILLACQSKLDWRVDLYDLLGIKLDDREGMSYDDITPYLSLTKYPDHKRAYITLFGEVIAHAGPEDNYIVLLHKGKVLDFNTAQLKLQSILLAFVKENFNKVSPLETIYGQLDTDEDVFFFSWESSVIDLSTQIKLTRKTITQVEFGMFDDRRQHCVTYAPEIRFDTKYAVISINDQQHLVKKRGDWLILARSPVGCLCNTASAEHEALLNEYKQQQTI